MDLIAHIHSRLVECIEDWKPSLRQFLECLVDKSGRPLRPGVNRVPHQGTRERRVCLQSKILACLCGILELVYCPGGAFFRFFSYRFGREAIEQFVVCGMYSNELALQVGREFGDLKAIFSHRSADFVCVVLALGSLLQVDATAIPPGYLHTFVSQRRHPLSYRFQAVERRLVAYKL